MSKAMDALKRLCDLTVYGSACIEDNCEEPECVEARKSLQIIRDYIETTEREKAAFVELEASVCPEDVGFDEYIKALQKHRDELAARIAALEAALAEKDAALRALQEGIGKCAQVEKAIGGEG